MIELKVEEYCHNCPEFEAVQHTEFYNHKIVCVHSRKCASIKEHLENTHSTEEPEAKTDPIKTADLCNRCAYCNCDYNCDACHLCGPTGRPGSCKCMFVEAGEPCPYFKEARYEKT